MTLTREQNRERMRRARAADRPVAEPGGPGPLSVAVDQTLALLPSGLVADRPIECAVVRRLAEQVDRDPWSPRAHLLLREMVDVIAGMRRAAYAYDND